jgi:hypothetical protein
VPPSSVVVQEADPEVPIVRKAPLELGFTSRVYPPFDAAPIRRSPTAVAEMPLIRRLVPSASKVILSSFTARVVPLWEIPSPAVIDPAPEN